MRSNEAGETLESLVHSIGNLRLCPKSDKE